LTARPHQVEQTAAPNQLGGQLVLTAGEFLDGNRLATADAVDQAEVGRGQDAQVAAILTVDPFEALGDDETNASAPLGKWTGLARGSLAVAPAGDGDGESSRLDATGDNRLRVAALETKVRIVAELLVVVIANPGRGDLVGRDIRAQWLCLLERKVLPGKLTLRASCDRNKMRPSNRRLWG